MPDHVGRRIAVTPSNKVEIEEFAISKPGNNQVLIRTICSLISAGTELGTQEQKRDGNIYMGYSNVGEIVSLGDEVKNYQVGDRVLSLGQHATHVVASAEPHALLKVPDEIASDQASFGVLGSISIHGVRKAKIELGEYVSITGMGLVGQLALQLALKNGYEAIIAFDLCSARLKKAAEHGATHTLNPDEDDLKIAIKKITEDRGLDITIEASGYPDALLYIFDLSRIGGRIVQLGSIWHRIVEVDFMDFHLKELTLIGCHQPKCPINETYYFPWTQQYNRKQILKMISDGRLDVDSLISHKLSYYEAEEAYRLLRDEKDKALGIILDWQE